MVWAALLSLCAAPDGELIWERETLRLLAPGGVYGRMIALPGEATLCAFERRGACYVARSESGGRGWQEPVEAARFEFGTAANPELCAIEGSTVLLAYNERPRDGLHPFTIRTAISRDGGRTWSPQTLVYTAGTSPEQGCWEPCLLRLPSGRLQLYFANEQPYPHSREQEISLTVSDDDGATWSRPRRIAFRPGGRDGMPVPLLRPERGDILLAIEDLVPGRKLQPALLRTSLDEPWPEGAEPDRWAPVDLAPQVYAGAPYLARLPDGRVLLSCQSDEGRAEPQMVVYLGDADAKRFGAATAPFDLPSTTAGRWNSLHIRPDGTVTAMTTTRLRGQAGFWAVDGRLAGQ